MTNKLHCPFCGAELDDTDCDSFVVCPNSKCKIGGDPMEKIVWQTLIDGKNAQEDLECMKHNYSVVSEQKEIAYQNYVKITGDLQKQLQKAQDALNKIIAIKESVEGCCAEIQQNCLPLLSSINRDIKLRIDEETSAIDKYMTEIDEITSITAGENKE